MASGDSYSILSEDIIIKGKMFVAAVQAVKVVLRAEFVWFWSSPVDPDYIWGVFCFK